MQADKSLVAYIATTYYNLSPVLGSIKALCGYSDKNFLITDSSDYRTYVLKIVNKDESIQEIADIIDEIVSNAYAYCRASSPSTTTLSSEPLFVVPKLIRTTGDKLSTFTSVRYHHGATTNNNGQASEHGLQEDLESSLETHKCNIKLFEFFDGITMFDYINDGCASVVARRPSFSRKPAEKLKGEKLYNLLGRVCNELFVFLRTQRHLLDKLNQARGDSFPWQLKTCEPHLRQLLDRLYPDERHTKRVLVERVLQDYNENIRPQLDQLPEFILHSDLCNKNILLNWEPGSQYLGRVCLIDFQDLQVGQQVIDLAVLMFYNIIEQEQMPFDKALKLIPQWIFSGYQSNRAAICALDPKELILIPTLMKLRLCQSLLNGQLAFEEDPQNTYVMHTNQRGWQLLELMSDEQSDLGDASKLVGFWLNK